MLRQPQFECRIFLPESQVSFFTGAADVLQNASLLGNKCVLEHEAEEPLKFGYFAVEPFEVVFVEECQRAVFQRIDVLGSGRLCQQAVQIGSPPVFDGELYNVFVAFVVEKVIAQAAPQHKSLIAAYFTCLQQKVLFLQTPYLCERSKKPAFLWFELNVTGDVLQ